MCCTKMGDGCPRPRGFARLLLNTIYPIPDPVSDEDQHARFHHHDLADMDRGSLRLEQERLRLRLLLDGAPGPWLVERLDALREALGDDH